MMSLSAIQAESRKAAAKAAYRNKKPYLVEQEDIDLWSRGRHQLPFPFIGDYVPKGFKLVDILFCDSSGLGTENEPALTYEQLIKKLEVGKCYAITETGLFQIYVGVYELV